MTVAACPKPETLVAFARGELAPEELAAVAGHVGGCEVCCRALKLIPEDTLANLARAAAADPFTVQSVGPPPTLLPTDPNETIPAGFADHPRYRIISKLGAGGMGTVYKAEDLLLGRVIAIKVMSPHLTAKAGAVARFQKEIRAAAQLKDHHIVIAHDAGEAGGSHYLVMEFVEGVSLDRLVAKKGPLPVSLACMFARQVALGLQHAADKGMVHRDIKPQNLMVSRKGQVKILDFGLARLAHNEAEEETLQLRRPAFGAGKQQVNLAVTSPNQVMGTPDYLSPEQARNSHEVDPRSDIYSLGCTLFFLLTGRPPFIASTTLIDKLLAHTEEDPPPIHDARPEVSEALAAVLAKMMAKKPADRYQKASEVAAALLPFTRSDAEKEPSFEIVEAVIVTPAPVAPSVAANPVVAVPPAGSSDTAPPGEPTLAETPRPKRAKKKKKRASWLQRRKCGVVGGVVALGLLIGAAFALHARKSNPPPSPPLTENAKLNDSPPRTQLDKNEKVNKKNPWNSGTVITPSTDLVVLYVIPSNGVFVPDYRDVRKELEVQRPGKGRVRVETAATFGDKSQPAGGFDEAVPIDVRLAVGMNLNKYAAVVFCGENVNEYLIPNGAGARAAHDVIDRMQKSHKPIAAICAGQVVLLSHSALRDKKAAIPPRVWEQNKYPGLLKDSSVLWRKEPVVRDESGGNVVITAAGPPQAREFADAILKAIE